jgi:4-hydroxybenzoate polyprenyltransferase
VRFGPARALWGTRILHLAAVALLLAAGLAASAGAIYVVGVVCCAAVLAWENLHVASGDVGRVAHAFGTANMVLSLAFAAFTLAEVTLS